MRFTTLSAVLATTDSEIDLGGPVRTSSTEQASPVTHAKVSSAPAARKRSGGRKRRTRKTMTLISTAVTGRKIIAEVCQGIDYPLTYAGNKTKVTGRLMTPHYYL